MSQTIAPPPGFSELSVEEKIAYVQALWDLIAENPDDVPVPDWHRAIIQERLQEAHSGPARPWSEVRAELQERLRSVRGG
jgi:putative addiction module component (TIGR02574 family)